MDCARNGGGSVGLWALMLMDTNSASRNVCFRFRLQWKTQVGNRRPDLGTGEDHRPGSTLDAIRLRRWNARDVSVGRCNRYRHSKLVGLQG